MDDFAKTLADLMERRDVEQLELAAAAGVSQSAISYYLQGRRTPRPATIERIAKALEVAPEVFMEYRRWRLHQQLDEWITQDEAGVRFLLERMRMRGDQK